MMTSSSPSSGIIPPAAPAPIEGCSETASTAAEGKRLKTDNDGGGGEDPAQKFEKGDEDAPDGIDEASGGGSRMPLVREELQPLENPVILTHLFQRCPPKLLAKFRLVSKQWRDLSLASWRDTAWITLYYPPTHPMYHPLFEEYREFMNNPENNCGVKPHRRMKLMFWNNDLRQEAMQSFWNRVGPDLTSLEFLHSEFPEVDDLRKIIFGSCPKLKRLSLHNCQFLKSALVQGSRELKYAEPQFGEQTNLRELSFERPSNDHQYYPLPIPWLELLGHFPSLTSLKASLSPNFLPRGESVYGELFNAIKIIRQRDARKLCIRSIELNPVLKFFDDGELGPHPDLSLFEELQLPLQFLDIEVYSRHKPRNKLLEDVLNRHRNTLMRITVSARFHVSWWFPCNVVLGKLEELRIHMVLSSLGFLKNMPQLKKLEFRQDPEFYRRSGCTETTMFSELDASTLRGVKLLHLTEVRMDYRLAWKDIASLARLMPNVRKLGMSLSDPLFGVVCRYWRDLKEMEVIGKDLTDKGVTGLDGAGNRIAFGNITNLQGLESFKFWSEDLTDRSVFQGFLKLPSLKFLELCDFFGRMSLGAEAKKALQDNKIVFSGTYQLEWDD